jgi:bile acid:Na+ symporter, BASS family
VKFFILLLLTLQLPLSSETISESSYHKIKDFVKNSSSNQLQELMPKLSNDNLARMELTKVYGNLRRLSNEGNDSYLYILRDNAGYLYIIAQYPKGLDLSSFLEDQMLFEVKAIPSELAGSPISFAYLQETPYQPMLNRAFTYLIAALLFIIMVGMGLTVSRSDFKEVLQSPKALVIGPLCQFGLLPLMAFSLGRLVGFHVDYPFIFIGLILVTACPSGVTSNLLTYLGKGDVALSVSLTTITTIASIVMTPLILSFYIKEIPGIAMPFGLITSHIAFLILTPLVIGMLVRYKFKPMAEKLKQHLKSFGIAAFTFLIIVGVLNNLDKFMDTARYGVKFYGVIFTITLSAMIVSIILARLLRLSIKQSRTIGLETGIQNAALAMALAIFLQDKIGDYHSSMFAVSGLFGLCMFLSATIVLFFFDRFLPVSDS